jgi:hypothetical protein
MMYLLHVQLGKGNGNISHTHGALVHIMYILSLIYQYQI